MAGIEVISSTMSLPNDALNGAVPTSQHVQPPQTSRVPAQPQQPPPPPSSQRIDPVSGGRIDIKI